MKASIAAVVFILTALLFFAPGRAEEKGERKKGEGKGTVLATINGVPITQEEFSRRLARLSSEGREFTASESKKELLEILVSREALAQEGRRLGLDRAEEVRERIDDVVKEILISAVLEKVSSEKATEEGMRVFFEKNRDEFKEVHASHILVKSEAEAKEIKKKIDGGGDFGELAKKQSQDPGSASRGGDLGYFTKGRMMKPFAEAAFSLKVNEVSGPVATQYGYHLIKVLDVRRPEKFVGLSPEISQAVKVALVNSEIEKIKTKAKVVYTDVPNP